MPSIKIKRAYEAPEKEDSFRVLVDRLWPRGKKREDLRLDAWFKELAPSDLLRTWFGHDPERWDEFKSHYFEELHEKDEEIERLLRDAGDSQTITLVYSSKEEKLNNAVALKEYLEKEKLHVKRAA